MSGPDARSTPQRTSLGLILPLPMIRSTCSGVVAGKGRSPSGPAAISPSATPETASWLTARHVARTAREKGWSNRLRGAGTPVMQGTPKAYSMDQELAQLDGGRGFDLTPEPAALNI